MDWSNLPQEIGPHGKRQDLLEIVDESGQFLEGWPFVSLKVVSVSGRETYTNATSMKGESLRVLSLAFTPSVEEEDGDRAITPARIRKRCVLIVGADRVQLDHSLGVMASVLGVMTATTSAISFGVVAFSLGRGLRPLEGVGAQVAQINEASLEKRIELDGLPNEILPITTKLNDLLNRLQISFARAISANKPYCLAASDRLPSSLTPSIFTSHNITWNQNATSGMPTAKKYSTKYTELGKRPPIPIIKAI